MNPNPFIAIFDIEGDLVEHFSDNEVRDIIFRREQVLDEQFPDYAPHMAYRWNGSGFEEVNEIHHHSKLISSKCIKGLAK